MVKFGIGQAVWRTGDQRLLLGQGRYLDASACPGNATGQVRPRPHQARDVAKPKAAPRRVLRAHRRRRAGGEARQLRCRLQNCLAPGGIQSTDALAGLDNREKMPHNGGGCADGSGTAFPLEEGWSAGIR